MNNKLISTLLGLCLASFAGVSQQLHDQPNFVFILVDDLGWADVKCNYPESFYETPNIDKLASNGICFTHAYSAHPVCSPTRAALLTGKHPNRVGITDWLPGADLKDRLLLGPNDRNDLSLEEITVAEVLKENGYKTGHAGKWHLGHDEKFWPEFQGFDVNIGGWEAGQPRIIPGVSNGYYSPYGNPRLSDGPEGEYLTDRLTDESIQFILENKENPFFLYLAFYTVHTPIQASTKHVEKFERKQEKMNLPEVPYEKEGDGWTKLVQDNAAYASMIAAMDENVGRIVESLKDNGLDKNTWIIFTSDNGGRSTLFHKNGQTSNKPLRAGKGWCYEGGIRVPLIIAGPDLIHPGRIEEQPVISMDFFPTILSLAKTDHEKNDGESLLPILINRSTINRNTLFWHYPHYHGSAWEPGSAIRKGDWKLLTFYENSRTELYNLKNDPGELNDVSEKFQQITLELKDQLFQKLDESNAQFPQPNPDFNP